MSAEKSITVKGVTYTRKDTPPAKGERAINPIYLPAEALRHFAKISESEGKGKRA